MIIRLYHAGGRFDSVKNRVGCRLKTGRDAGRFARWIDRNRGWL
ncbi:hypothetical protein [Enterocloster clostridioformis]|nr:hypothetical protein [Enterocloster clostridioformis]